MSIASCNYLLHSKYVKKVDALFGLIRIPLDALAVCAALLLSYRLRLARIDLVPGFQLLKPAQFMPDLHYYLLYFVLPGTLLFLALAGAVHLFSLRSTMSGWSEAMRVLLANTALDCAHQRLVFPRPGSAVLLTRTPAPVVSVHELFSPEHACIAHPAPTRTLAFWIRKTPRPVCRGSPAHDPCEKRRCCMTFTMRTWGTSQIWMRSSAYSSSAL